MTVRETSAADREIVAWSAIAVAALGIAGLFALLLALSRVPGIETVFPWPVGFFGKGLVIHVVFSFVVWFLAAFATLAVAVTAPTDGARPAGPLRLAPAAAAAIGLPLLFVPALRDAGEATLNNYIPVIIDPLYYLGLLLIGAAVGAIALTAVRGGHLTAWRKDPLATTVASAGIAYLAALVAFAIAWAGLAGSPADYAFNEHLMWGGGHILQFVNTILAILAWGTLAQLATGRVAPAAIAAVSAGLAAVSVLALFLYAAYPAFSGPQMLAFTRLQYALGPSAMVVVWSLAVTLPGPVAWQHPAMRCLWLSIVIFAVGGVLGLFVDGADTRTPAHYHGVIAGMSLALMGVFLFVILPKLGRRAPSRRRAAWTLGLFGWGQLAACVGLFVAGGHGTPRKIAGEAQGLMDLPAYAGMALNGIGALVAIVGGVLFVWTMAAALLRAPADEKDTVRVRPAL